MRNPKQIRLEVAFHEAGHAVTGFLSGRRIERVGVWSEEQLSDSQAVTDTDHIGRVVFQDFDPTSLSEAVDDIVMYYAGDAAARMAWASGIVTDEQIGVTTVITTEDLSVDELLASNGRTPVESAVAYGMYRMPSKDDAALAADMAKEWTSDPLELAALLGFCQRRTANLAATEQFQIMVGYLAVQLEEKGEMGGDLVHHLLDRQRAVQRL